MNDAIQTHNQPAAALWTLGGTAYDDVSFQVSDAISHAVHRMWPRAGEKILDVATGTGWTARTSARWGAHVTGVDIAADLLAAAEELSGHIRPGIEFQLADAEKLPFEDATFDGVISTFGVMFAGNHNNAAAELARVCKPGGRLVLATWDPAGSIAEFFGVAAKHSGAPPPPMSPMLWGKTEHVTDLLSDSFDLKFEKAASRLHYPDAEAVWDAFTAGFGPVRALAGRLEGDARKAFKDDFIAFHNKSRTEAGLDMMREYLLTMGIRK